VSRPDVALMIRPAHAGDLHRLFGVLGDEIARGRQDIVPDERRVARMLATFDWEARSRVALRDGDIVGCVFVVTRPSPEGVLANLYAGGENDAYRDLVRWGVDCARAAGAVSSQVLISRARREDLAGLGLRPARPWLRMDRTAAGPLPEAVSIGGYVLADGRSAPDRSWAETFNRTFADHWRFAPRSEQEIVGERPPELSLMALTAGDRSPVALTLGDIEAYAGDPRPQPVGLISSVGTVPAHRRRGLARWLVAEMLIRLGDAGARHVSLYVDGRNATRAFDLYRKLGFEVTFEAEVWEAS
jgi:ribosomal protein S18 acetylase RimI-like enzyme